jgi:hypothetical protein
MKAKNIEKAVGTCGDCLYWKPQKIQSTPAEKSCKGFCTCNPPQISDRQVEKYFSQGLRGCELGLHCSWWPATDQNDGCGKFAAKEV